MTPRLIGESASRSASTATTCVKHGSKASRRSDTGCRAGAGIALPDVAMTAAERKQKQRRRAKAKGRCQVCARRKALAGLTVCRICNNKAKDRVRRWRAI